MAQNTQFSLCSLCNKSQLTLKPTKFDTLFISCSGYPECKNSMSMPKGISNLNMLNQSC